MFLVNGFKAKLRQYNRNQNQAIYDDQNYQETEIKVIPYNLENSVKFREYTVPEAVGYFIVSRETNIREGDQILFYQEQVNLNNLENRTYSVLKVIPNWIFNRIENYIVAIK